jgi:hypothetical protein
MMLRHPVFALRHWLDGFKKAPASYGRRREKKLAEDEST